MAVNPLYAELRKERFGPSRWWTTRQGPAVDNDLECGRRRRSLSEALNHDNEEEVA